MNEIAERLAERLFDQPIIENQYRSAFVEEMIKPSLEASGWEYAGGSWCGWDFGRLSDGARLELKQSAAAQTWSEARKIKTRGAFDIATRTGYFSEEGAKWNPGAGRPADVYAFAWNSGNDHRDSDRWEFFVVTTSELPDQKTISLSKIKALAIECGQPKPLKLPELAGRLTELLRNHPPIRIDSSISQA